MVWGNVHNFNFLLRLSVSKPKHIDPNEKFQWLRRGNELEYLEIKDFKKQNDWNITVAYNTH